MCNFRKLFLTGVRAWGRVKSAGPTRGRIGENPPSFRASPSTGPRSGRRNGHRGEPPCGFDCRSAYADRLAHAFFLNAQLHEYSLAALVDR